MSWFDKQQAQAAAAAKPLNKGRASKRPGKRGGRSAAKQNLRNERY